MIVDLPTQDPCRECGFKLFLPIANLSLSTLALYDDHRFPGRCILSLRQHYGDLLDVPGGVLTWFMEDIRIAARAIQNATKCDRINYAILMNSVAHVHAHLIPRTYATDPIPNKAPWEHPEKAWPLSPTRRAEEQHAIDRELVRFTGVVPQT
jgi:diadenosine tetraphosphate (Ap4A) HIT family hydrolase